MQDSGILERLILKSGFPLSPLSELTRSLS